MSWFAGALWHSVDGSSRDSTSLNLHMWEISGKLVVFAENETLKHFLGAIRKEIRIRDSTAKAVCFMWLNNSKISGRC